MTITKSTDPVIQTGVKRYELTYADYYSVTVEIDYSIMSADLLQQINDFWSDSEHRLAAADGNLLHAVLKMFCTAFMKETVESWSPVETFARKEGWPALDGSQGIKVVRYNGYEFDENEVMIDEVAA